MVYTYACALIVFVLLFAVNRRGGGRVKLLRAGMYTVGFLLTLEILCVIAIRLKSGYWLFRTQYNANADLFVPHPYLVGVPKKNTAIEIKGKQYTHNASGFRGKDIPQKSNKMRVIAVGGSGTYGTHVGDNETWPYYLDSICSAQCEVLNLGIPGHTTAEHIVYSSLIAPEFAPDMVIVRCGLNDMRNVYVKELASDYSDYHASRLYGILGFCHMNKLPRIAIVRVGVILLQKAGLYPRCEYHNVRTEMDHGRPAKERALSLYRRNLHSLAAIYKSCGTRVLFLPEVICRQVFKPNEMKWWIPYVEDGELWSLMQEYNAAMRDEAMRDSVDYAGEILEENWKKEDFLDAVHFTPDANRRFASLVQRHLLDSATLHAPK